MMTASKAVLSALSGHTLATAESCTGGAIGAALTAIPGASAVYAGGIISYCNEIKHKLLGVPTSMLEAHGAVSAPVAEAMATGARTALNTDVAVSVTGLAGPDADEFGNLVGTVFIGYADARHSLSRHFLFAGDREEVRRQAVQAALQLVVEDFHG